MGVNRLDIEFEDDEEAKAKEKLKKNMVVEEVEIDFSAGSYNASEKIEENKEEKLTKAEAKRTLNANETSLESREKDGLDKVESEEVFIDKKGYQLGDEIRRVCIKNQLLAVEIEARIQVETQKRIMNLFAQHASDKKLLEYKVNKLISQIAAKAPVVKKELIMIKKVLSEHAAIESAETKVKKKAKKEAA